MPVIGLGTWKSDPGKVGEAVTYALGEAGYKHVDCAWIYGNEKEIGQAFKDVFSNGSLKRDDVFVTSKLWNSFHAKHSVAKACKDTLADLKLDYLDLYLIHWGIATPFGEKEPMGDDGVLITDAVPIRETWEAMQELVKAGLVKAIGVSNFTTPMILDLLTYAAIPPAVNQIEVHPYLQQAGLIEFCRRKNIAVTAYSPLGRPGAEPARPFLRNRGGERLINDAVIVEIAGRHKKTSAQVLLKWGVQRGTIVIPKSVTPSRIKENIDIFEFELSKDEMQNIAGLEIPERLVNPIEWWGIPYFD